MGTNCAIVNSAVELFLRKYAQKGPQATDDDYSIQCTWQNRVYFYDVKRQEGADVGGTCLSAFMYCSSGTL